MILPELMPFAPAEPEWSSRNRGFRAALLAHYTGLLDQAVRHSSHWCSPEVVAWGKDELAEVAATAVAPRPAEAHHEMWLCLCEVLEKLGLPRPEETRLDALARVSASMAE